MRILLPLLFLTLFAQGQNNFFRVNGGTTIATLGGFVVDGEDASFIVNYYTIGGDYEKRVGDHFAFNLGAEINTAFGRYRTLWAGLGGGIKAPFKEYDNGLFFHFNVDYGYALRAYNANAERTIFTSDLGLGYAFGNLSVSSGVGLVLLGGHFGSARFKIDDYITYTHIGEYILPIKVSYSIPLGE